MRSRIVSDFLELRQKNEFVTSYVDKLISQADICHKDTSLVYALWTVEKMSLLFLQICFTGNWNRGFIKKVVSEKLA